MEKPSVEEEEKVENQEEEEGEESEDVKYLSKIYKNNL
jgi:hypothetical protein